MSRVASAVLLLGGCGTPAPAFLDMCLVGGFVSLLFGGWALLAWAAGVSIETYAGDLVRSGDDRWI